MQGKIVKGIAGFYYVHVPGTGILECKARGIFRKDKTKPLVGDNVEVERMEDDTSNNKGNIVSIKKRKNECIRPAVANVDQAIIIFASAEPMPNFNLLDRFLIMMQQNGIDTMICFNKKDLVSDKVIREIVNIYGNSNCKLMFSSTFEEEDMKRLKELLVDKTTVLAGPSGVGKSSIINRLIPTANMETGAISEKVKRGKHTTRHAELFCVEKSTYIMDTPGFSSLDLSDMEKEELKNWFPEFYPYEGKCKYQGCVHINEPQCAVKEALNRKLINETRYKNYLLLFEECKNRRKY